jgi:ABC-type transporter Mla subunit MlaD
MKREHQEMLRNFIAGLFFVGGIVLVIAIVFLLGAERGFSRAKFQITVLYSDINGLIEGAPVHLAGHEVGYVADISFLEQPIRQRRLKVTLDIYDMYRPQLNQTARFTIQPEGVLGEKLLKIYVPGNGPPLDESLAVMGAEPLDVQDLAVVFSEAAESFTQTSEQLSGIDLEQLSSVMSETAESVADTSQAVSEALEEMEYVAKKAKRLLNRVEEKIIDGSLFKVF